MESELIALQICPFLCSRWLQTPPRHTEMKSFFQYSMFSKQDFTDVPHRHNYASEKLYEVASLTLQAMARQLAKGSSEPGQLWEHVAYPLSLPPVANVHIYHSNGSPSPPIQLLHNGKVSTQWPQYGSFEGTSRLPNLLPATVDLSPLSRCYSREIRHFGGEIAFVISVISL